MKDSKTIRNEHQSFVDAWKKIQEDNSSAPVEEGYKDVKKMLKTNKGYKKESKVLVRKSNAFTALAEKYNMSPKQFGRYVEACLLYTSPSPRDKRQSRMPSSA